MIDSILYFFDIGGFWAALLVIVLLLLVVSLVIAICSPCVFTHLNGYLGECFCSRCGLQLRPYCSSCSIYHHPVSVYCDVCGSPLQEVQE